MRFMFTFQRLFGSSTAKCSFLRDGHKTSLWSKIGSEVDEPAEIEGREEEHVEDEIEEISAENKGQISTSTQSNLATYLVTKLWRKLRRHRRPRRLSPQE
jgi:hypothetical protein